TRLTRNQPGRGRSLCPDEQVPYPAGHAAPGDRHPAVLRRPRDLHGLPEVERKGDLAIQPRAYPRVDPGRGDDRPGHGRGRRRGRRVLRETGQLAEERAGETGKGKGRVTARAAYV